MGEVETLERIWAPPTRLRHIKGVSLRHLSVPTDADRLFYSAWVPAIHPRRPSGESPTSGPPESTFLGIFKSTEVPASSSPEWGGPGLDALTDPELAAAPELVLCVHVVGDGAGARGGGERESVARDRPEARIPERTEVPGGADGTPSRPGATPLTTGRREGEAPDPPPEEPSTPSPRGDDDAPARRESSLSAPGQLESGLSASARLESGLLSISRLESGSFVAPRPEARDPAPVPLPLPSDELPAEALAALAEACGGRWPGEPRAAWRVTLSDLAPANRPVAPDRGTAVLLSARGGLWRALRPGGAGEGGPGDPGSAESAGSGAVGSADSPWAAGLSLAAAIEEAGQAADEAEGGLPRGAGGSPAAAAGGLHRRALRRRAVAALAGSWPVDGAGPAARSGAPPARPRARRPRRKRAPAGDRSPAGDSPAAEAPRSFAASLFSRLLPGSGAAGTSPAERLALGGPGGLLGEASSSEDDEIVEDDEGSSSTTSDEDYSGGSSTPSSASTTSAASSEHEGSDPGGEAAGMSPDVARRSPGQSTEARGSAAASAGPASPEPPRFSSPLVAGAPALQEARERLATRAERRRLREGHAAAPRTRRVAVVALAEDIRALAALADEVAAARGRAGRAAERLGRAAEARRARRARRAEASAEEAESARLRGLAAEARDGARREREAAASLRAALARRAEEVSERAAHQQVLWRSGTAQARALAVPGGAAARAAGLAGAVVARRCELVAALGDALAVGHATVLVPHAPPGGFLEQRLESGWAGGGGWEEAGRPAAWGEVAAPAAAGRREGAPGLGVGPSPSGAQPTAGEARRPVPARAAALDSSEAFTPVPEVRLSVAGLVPDPRLWRPLHRTPGGPGPGTGVRGGMGPSFSVASALGASTAAPSLLLLSGDHDTEADPADAPDPAEERAAGVVLGQLALFVERVAAYLDVPLLHPVGPCGSSSFVCVEMQGLALGGSDWAGDAWHRAREAEPGPGPAPPPSAAAGGPSARGGGGAGGAWSGEAGGRGGRGAPRGGAAAAAASGSASDPSAERRAAAYFRSTTRSLGGPPPYRRALSCQSQRAALSAAELAYRHSFDSSREGGAPAYYVQPAPSQGAPNAPPPPLLTLRLRGRKDHPRFSRAVALLDADLAQLLTSHGAPYLAWGGQGLLENAYALVLVAKSARLGGDTEA